MRNSIQHCGVLIIAAGQSKRLGQPKQLLPFEGKSLLNRLIDTVQAAGTFPITLVLGAAAGEVEAQLTASDLNLVINENWEEGMGSSIRIGMENVSNEVDGVMILVCDQPFISKENIQSLFNLQKETAKPIAACYYAGVLGTPALFHKSQFPYLLALKGDTGAKKIINSNEAEVAKLHFEEGVIDIDTIEDYQNLIKKQEAK